MASSAPLKGLRSASQEATVALASMALQQGKANRRNFVDAKCLRRNTDCRRTETHHLPAH
jgi:hypothetical protein